MTHRTMIRGGATDDVIATPATIDAGICACAYEAVAIGTTAEQTAMERSSKVMATPARKWKGMETHDTKEEKSARSVQPVVNIS